MMKIHNTLRKSIYVLETSIDFFRNEFLKSKLDLSQEYREGLLELCHVVEDIAENLQKNPYLIYEGKTYVAHGAGWIASCANIFKSAANMSVGEALKQSELWIDPDEMMQLAEELEKEDGHGYHMTQSMIRRRPFKA